MVTYNIGSILSYFRENMMWRRLGFLMSLLLLLHIQLMVGHFSKNIINDETGQITITICTDRGFEEISFAPLEGDVPQIPHLQNSIKCPLCTYADILPLQGDADRDWLIFAPHILLAIVGEATDYIPSSPHIKHIPPPRAPPFFVFS